MLRNHMVSIDADTSDWKRLVDTHLAVVYRYTKIKFKSRGPFNFASLEISLAVMRSLVISHGFFDDPKKTKVILCVIHKIEAS